MTTLRGTFLLFLVLEASCFFQLISLSSTANFKPTSPSVFFSKSLKTTPGSERETSFSPVSLSPSFSGSSVGVSVISVSENGSISYFAVCASPSNNINFNFNNSRKERTAALYHEIVSPLNLPYLPTSILSTDSVLSVILKHFEAFDKAISSIGANNLTEESEKYFSRDFLKDIFKFSYDQLLLSSFLVLILDFKSFIFYRIVMGRIMKDFSSTANHKLFVRDLPFYHFKTIFHDNIQLAPFTSIADPKPPVFPVPVMFSIISNYFESTQSHNTAKLHKISNVVDSILRNGLLHVLDNFLPNTKEKFSLFPIAFHSVSYNFSLNKANTQNSVVSILLNKILNDNSYTKITVADINSLAVTASHFDDFTSFSTIFNHKRAPNILEILPFIKVFNCQMKDMVISRLPHFDKVTLDMKLLLLNSPDPLKILKLFCSSSCSLSHIIAKLMYQDQFSFIVNDFFPYTEVINLEEIVKEFVAMNGIESMKSGTFNLENWIFLCSQSFHFSELPNYILPILFESNRSYDLNQIIIRALDNIQYVQNIEIGHVFCITNESSYAIALNLLSYSTGRLDDFISQALNCESATIALLFALEDDDRLLSFIEIKNRSVTYMSLDEECVLMQIFTDPNTRFDIPLFG